MSSISSDPTSDEDPDSNKWYTYKVVIAFIAIIPELIWVLYGISS
ncbi:MAG: hypothetical protein R6V22_02260 [Rhodohalobacter sp.]